MNWGNIIDICEKLKYTSVYKKEQENNVYFVSSVWLGNCKKQNRQNRQNEENLIVFSAILE